MPYPITNSTCPRSPMVVSVQVLRTAADRRGEQKQREGGHRQQKHADEEIPELGKVREKRERRERGMEREEETTDTL